MGTTALTTFADGTVGTVAGILQFLGKGIGRYAEGDSDGFEVSIKKFQSENLMKIFVTRKQRKASKKCQKKPWKKSIPK